MRLPAFIVIQAMSKATCNNIHRQVHIRLRDRLNTEADYRPLAFCSPSHELTVVAELQLMAGVSGAMLKTCLLML